MFKRHSWTPTTMTVHILCVTNFITDKTETLLSWIRHISVNEYYDYTYLRTWDDVVTPKPAIIHVDESNHHNCLFQLRRDRSRYFLFPYSIKGKTYNENGCCCFWMNSFVGFKFTLVFIALSSCPSTPPIPYSSPSSILLSFPPHLLSTFIHLEV